MKFKVIEPYQRFWIKVFNYINENNLEPYSVLFYVTLTPSVINLQNKKALRFFERIRRMYSEIFEKKIIASERYYIYLLYILRIYDQYSQFKYLPSKNAEGLNYLYEAIMHDFRNGEEVTFEEALNDEGNVASTKIIKRSWYIINSILNNTNQEEVRKIIEKSNEEEKERVGETPKTKEHVNGIISLYLSGSFDKEIDEIIQKWSAGIKEDEIHKILLGEVEGDKLILPRKMDKLFFALLLYYQHSTADFQKLQEAYEQLKMQYDATYSLLTGDIKMLIEENQKLKDELLNAKTTNIEKVYIDQSDKINLIKKEYEKRIAELEEEVKNWREIANEAIEKQVIQEEKIEPFEEPIYIAYFGLNNPALFSFLANYNVHVKLFSPYEAPTVVPDLPIVFNIDVASHEVWDHIKGKKPFLVSGSNAEILGKKILKWLKK